MVRGVVCWYIVSGSNVWAVLKVAKQLGRAKTVVVTLYDIGERYFFYGTVFEV